MSKTINIFRDTFLTIIIYANNNTSCMHSSQYHINIYLEKLIIEGKVKI